MARPRSEHCRKQQFEANAKANCRKTRWQFDRLNFNIKINNKRLFITCYCNGTSVCVEFCHISIYIIIEPRIFVCLIILEFLKIKTLKNRRIKITVPEVDKIPNSWPDIRIVVVQKTVLAIIKLENVSFVRIGVSEDSRRRRHFCLIHSVIVEFLKSRHIADSMPIFCNKLMRTFIENFILHLTRSCVAG